MVPALEQATVLSMLLGVVAGALFLSATRWGWLVIPAVVVTAVAVILQLGVWKTITDRDMITS